MAALFSPETLAGLRALNDANLPDSCTASIPADFQDDDEGGGTYGTPTETTFPCRVSPLNAREMETLVADQLREPGLEKLVFAVGQALPVTATVEVTIAETSEALRYEVKGIVPDPTFVMLRRAIIKRIHDPVSDEGS